MHMRDEIELIVGDVFYIVGGGRIREVWKIDRITPKTAWCGKARIGRRIWAGFFRPYSDGTEPKFQFETPELQKRLEDQLKIEQVEGWIERKEKALMEMREELRKIDGKGLEKWVKMIEYGLI
jgi:hypothetical protein